MLYGIHGHAERQIGKLNVDAPLLIHRHHIILQAVVHILPLELPLHYLMT